MDLGVQAKGSGLNAYPTSFQKVKLISLQSDGKAPVLFLRGGR